MYCCNVRLIRYTFLDDDVMKVDMFKGMFSYQSKNTDFACQCVHFSYSVTKLNNKVASEIMIPL